MATVVLSAVGAYFGGPIGAAVGAYIGSQIDAAIINTFSSPLKIGKLDNLRATTVDEGADAPWVSGPRCRVPGQVIWMSALREVRHSSGGGFSGPRVLRYSYFRDVAVAFARRECEALNRLWIGNQIVYSSIAGNTVVSNEIGFDTTSEIVTTGSGSSVCQTRFYTVFITHFGNNNEFSAFAPGGTVTVSGAAHAELNGTFDVWNVITDAQGVLGRSQIHAVRCSTSTCDPTAVCAPWTVDNVVQGPSITVSQSAFPLTPGLMDSMTFYTGSQSQTADPTMVGIEGVGNVPAYRGTCYVVLKNLEVTKYSGSMPTFDADLRQAATKTYAELITELCTLSGKLTSAYVACPTLSLNVTGFVASGVFSPREMVKAAMISGAIDAQEREGALRFYNRADAVTIDVADDSRGTREAGGDAPRLLEMEPAQLTQLPTVVRVNAFDINKNGQPGTREARVTYAPKENPVTYNLPLVMQANSIHFVAKRELWWQRGAVLGVRLQLPYNCMEIAETDRLTVRDSDGNEQLVRVQRITRGALNGLLKIEARSVEPESLEQSALGTPGVDDAEEDPPIERVELPAPVKLTVIDAALAGIDLSPDKAGLVFAASSLSSDSTLPWSGCRVWVSVEGGDYRELFTNSDKAVTGVAITTLQDGAPDEWDAVNTVTVRMDSDDDVLESIAEDEVLASGANMMLVGGEVIQFSVATLVDDRTYELSMLRRGLRSTESATSTHTGDGDGDEWCVLLSGPGLTYFEMPGDREAMRFFRAVPPTLTHEDAMVTIPVQLPAYAGGGGGGGSGSTYFPSGW